VTLILRMGQRPCSYLFCLYWLPIRTLWITSTKSLVNYCTYQATNRCRSIDAYYNVLSIKHLLLLRIVFIITCLYRLCFCPIDTQYCCEAERRNILALCTFTPQKVMYHVKRFIAPAIPLFMKWYSQATSHQPKFSVKLHKEAGEPLMHAVLLCLHSFISPPCYCIARHQHHVSLAHWSLCWPDQSGNNWRGTNILLLWAFRILKAIVLLYIGFIIRCAIF
jgi:hypothetical protein